MIGLNGALLSVNDPVNLSHSGSNGNNVSDAQYISLGFSGSFYLQVDTYVSLDQYHTNTNVEASSDATLIEGGCNAVEAYIYSDYDWHRKATNYYGHADYLYWSYSIETVSGVSGYSSVYLHW